MKIGEPCYAVVDEGGFSPNQFPREISANTYAESIARPEVNYRVVECTLLPTSEVARLRKCEAENVKLRKFVTALTEWDRHGKAGGEDTNIHLAELFRLLDEAASLTPSGDGETD